MRKKIFTLIIATMLIMSTTLVGCNDIDTNDIKETETVVTDTETTESVTETETVSEETTEVVEAVTEAVTETTSKNTETVNKTPTSTSTSNTSSSGESNSKPTEHVHTWVDITEDVVVTDSPATTKQEAWDETIVDEPERYDSYTVFNYDGYRPTDGDDLDKHGKELILAGHKANYHSEYVTIPAVTHIEHHDAVYQTVEVPAVTHVETRVVGQKCNTCGATK